MQLKVKLSFSDQERVIITDFAKQIGMNVPEFCKRAVFYSINDSYKRAEVLRGQSQDRNSVGDTAEGLSVEQSSDSSTLADQKDTLANASGSGAPSAG